MDKRKFIADSLFRSAGLFVFATFAYLLVAMGFTTDADVSLRSCLLLVTGKLAILLGFSLIFGFSYIVFEWRSASNTVKRTVHVCLLLLTWVPAFLLTGVTNYSAKNIVLGVLLAAAIMLVAYPLGMLAVYLYRRIFQNKR